MKEHKIYAEVLDGKTLTQFMDAMSQPFVTRGALMPDAHLGYSVPIGSVIETDGVIIPAWVGYDIGCGVSATKTNLKTTDLIGSEEAIFNSIYEVIPVGRNIHDKEQEIPLPINSLSEKAQEVFNKRKGAYQIGTLGGGNHFIEIGADEDDCVWIIIHSGSRGVGHGIATEYMKLASNSDKAKEGHYGLKVSSELGRSYIKDMEWCLEDALANRQSMSLRVCSVLQAILCRNATVEHFINRNHNHATSKDGIKWVHRKGATHAELGMEGVIPGNMKDGSFIVVGKGCEESLCSSSHGAGRVLGRRQAKEQLDVGEFQQMMTGVTAKVGDATLDECPLAYKDIFEVMGAQTDLVKVVAHVKPIINIKG